ncbi:MAG: hypothetical protein HY765_02180, partial [Rhodomicrobium sp.]|nr:hypothetical protein [Rhodomicrobium sp.]
AKADNIREQLLKLTAALLDQSSASREAPGARNDTIGRLPEAKSAGKPTEATDGRDSLRRQIHDLATQTLAIDPLNAKAFRLLAEITDSPDRVREWMQEAYKRSRRESIALFWLLNDSYYRNDYEAALGYAGILLRTRPALSAYIFSYLSLIADTPEGLPIVTRELAAGPRWRGSFLNALPRTAKQWDTPLKLMIALRESGKPPSNEELAPYLDGLIGKNLVDAAYNVWLQFLPRDEFSTLGLLTNGSFEAASSGLPFDWRIQRGLNAVAEFSSLGSERTLHIGFGTGRVRFPEVSQVVLLAPGRYRLEGRLRGRIISKRGLRWQLRCATGSRKVLGETDMLMGQSQEWRIFVLDAEVPQNGKCVGQTLRLFHDSRSASEELISGDAWFAGLGLRRIPDQSAEERTANTARE